MPGRSFRCAIRIISTMMKMMVNAPTVTP
jgi:hypothetical protein